MDPFNLERFVTAQAPVYATALKELQAGSKQSHWMWFVFPQLQGLGSSAMAQRYAISGAEEARAYLAHPILGHRLSECTEAVNAEHARSAFRIFGSPDDMKFHSSMTLFAAVAEDPTLFAFALDKYFSGQRDPRTLSLLAGR